MNKWLLVLVLGIVVSCGCATSKTKGGGDTLSDRACAAIENENYDKAEKLLEEAIQINHKNAFAWLNLGVVNQKQERYDKAKECYLKVVEFAWDEKGSNKASGGRSLVRIARDNLDKIPAY